MSFTFKVADVPEETKKLEHNYTIREISEHITGKKQFESCSNPDLKALFLSNYGLMGTAGLSFKEHYPLIIDPDIIWITITHGLAEHINQNAEALRKKFVSFEGKQFIEIRRDYFVKGKIDNPWDNCFPEFSDRIAEYIGDKRDLIVSNFTTTTSIRKVISEIVLMDAMKSYFSYGMRTCCGIPRITLEGTTDDWKDIRNRVNAFDDWDLSWWTEYLKPVLDEFVNTVSGNPNKEFWNSFYNYNGGSGGPFVGGNIIALYPYLEGYKTKSRNNFSSLKEGGKRGRAIADFPNIISKVPFTWNYYGKEFNMQFIGGLIGAEQKEDGSISSSFNWAIGNEKELLKDNGGSL